MEENIPIGGTKVEETSAKWERKKLRKARPSTQRTRGGPLIRRTRGVQNYRRQVTLEPQDMGIKEVLESIPAVNDQRTVLHDQFGIKSGVVS